MDELQSSRCNSEELDSSLQYWIKTLCDTHSPSDQDLPHTPNSLVSVMKLQATISALEKKNQDLLYINNKWAEQYRNLMQECKHMEMSRRSINCEQLKEDKGKRKKNFTKVTTDSTQETQLKSRLHESERQIEYLRRQCDTLTTRVQQQEQEILRLNKALSGAYKNSVSQQEDAQTGQDMWMHQAQLYKEDFFKERRDKDRLKEKYTELEHRFKRIHTELHVVKAKGPSPHM